MNHPFVSLVVLFSGIGLLAAGEMPGVGDTQFGPFASLGGVGIVGWLALTLLKGFREELEKQRVADIQKEEAHFKAMEKLSDALNLMRVHCAETIQREKVE